MRGARVTPEDMHELEAAHALFDEDEPGVLFSVCESMVFDGQGWRPKRLHWILPQVRIGLDPEDVWDLLSDDWRARI